MKKETIFIYGKHALIEALQNAPKTIEKVFLASNTDEEINGLLNKNNIVASKFSGETKDTENRESHQGIIAKISLEKLLIPYGDFISSFKINKNTCFVLFAGLQDPHNVGTTIRSAVAFGASGILIPSQNQSPITGTVVKTSAGMTFRVPLISINDINETVSDLKKRGCVVYGLEGESKVSIVGQKFDQPSVFVMGNESKGISVETLKLCDKTISIPIDAKCESLNVATSAGIVLYEWKLKHSAN